MIYVWVFVHVGKSVWNWPEVTFMGFPKLKNFATKIFQASIMVFSMKIASSRLALEKTDFIKKSKRALALTKRWTTCKIISIRTGSNRSTWDACPCRNNSRAAYSSLSKPNKTAMTLWTKPRPSTRTKSWLKCTRLHIMNRKRTNKNQVHNYLFFFVRFEVFAAVFHWSSDKTLENPTLSAF